MFTDVINFMKSRFLPENLISVQLVNKMPAFQGLESSLPFSQKLVPCPSPEPDESSLHPLNIFLKTHFEIKGCDSDSVNR
jgi:hypothetical protein